MSQQSLNPEDIRNARRLHAEADGARQAQQQRRESMASQHRGYGVMKPTANYLDIPIIEDNDIYFVGNRHGRSPFDLTPKPEYFDDYERACGEDEVATVQQIISQNSCTPAMLHHGLTLALAAGSTSCVRELLLRGAPIAQRAPEKVLSAPQDKRISLLNALVAHGGWEPSHDIFMKAIPDPELLKWFLSNGVDPNYGMKRGQPSHECADALETAASVGSADAIEVLIAAGAQIAYGTPLHFAAGAAPPDQEPYSANASQPEELDTGRIPAMAALVANGADVNQFDDLPNVHSERYALVHAVQVGAARRARWLVEHGADPHLRGDYGSAAEYAAKMGSVEMKEVFQSYQQGSSR